MPVASHFQHESMKHAIVDSIQILGKLPRNFVDTTAQDPASSFIVRKLEVDAWRSHSVLARANHKEICSLAQHLSESLELALQIRQEKCYADNILQFLHNSERRSERIRQRYWRKTGNFVVDEEEMYEFMLTTATECGLESETYFQVTF